MRREDTVTGTEDDAAHFERWRAQAFDDYYSDRPTKAELDGVAP